MNVRHNVRFKFITALTLALIIVLNASLVLTKAQQQEVFIIASMKYIKNPNPLKEETWYDWWLNLVMYDRLFREGPDLEVYPWLCMWYEHTPDGLTWTFTIVPNATWHDGVLLTAEDVVFTIKFYQEYKPASWYPQVADIDKAEVINTYTFRIHLKEVNVWLLRTFGTIIILPKHIWSYVPQAFSDPTTFNPLNPDDVSKVLNLIKKSEPLEIYSKVEAFVSKYKHLRVGSGPYILTRWVEGELLDLSKHPNYFKAGFPRADRLVFKVYTTAESQYLAVKANEAHIMMWNAPYAILSEAEANPSLKVPKTFDTYVGFIGFNLRDPITGNKLFRKAVAYALDKAFIVNTLMMGYAVVAYTYIHPNIVKYVNVNVPKYEFNLTKAAKLLDEAGFKDVDGDGWRETPDGKKFELTIYSPEYDPVRVRICDILVENLGKIGVKAKNIALEFDTLIDYVYNKNQFQIYIIENDANFMPWYYDSYYVEEQARPGGNNPWGFINKTFENLLSKAKSELNDDVRAKLYKDMQAILAEELPLIPIYIRYWIQIYRTELSGVVDMPGGPLNFWTIINANFRGIKAELPYTKLVQPTTPTITSVLATTITITQTVTQPTTVTITTTTVEQVVRREIPSEYLIASALAVIIVGIVAFFLGSKVRK